jgi:hypothetical protein
MSFLLTPDEIILINNFCNMYSTNIRLMESLNRSNEELRNSINYIIHRHNGDSNHNNYFNNNPNNINNNRNNRNNSNLNRFGRNQNHNLHDYGCIESTRYGNSNVYNRNNNHNRNMNRNRNNNILNTTNDTILQTFFEPVVIFPTQMQIENATRIATFGDIVNPINTSCPISLERFNDDDQVIIIRYCGHIFSVDELNQWFRNRVKCPVCRYDIRTYVSNTYLNDETQIDSNNILSENNTENNNETSMNQEIPIIRRFDLSNNLVTNEILNNMGLNSTFWRDLFDVNNDNNYYLDPSSNTFLFTMTRYI